MEKPLKNLLFSHGVKLKKAYGQNFLTDEDLLQEICDGGGVNKDICVLEIGCGAGALTKVLAKNAKRVIGYEIDQTLKPILDETLAGLSNVEIVFKDVMKEKVCELEKRFNDDYIIVANLPYYITTPIVMNFLEHAKKLKSMVIMVQKEVADRFCALPSTSDYGAITVGINLRANARQILYVPREKFTPIPNVDSAVVRIDMIENKFDGADFEAVREIVRVGFSSRRKMLVNNIMNSYKLDRKTVENIMENASVSLTARGEALSVEDYIRLSNELKGYGK